MKPTFLISFFLIGTLVMIGIMRWHGQVLSTTTSTKAGIVALELAKTKSRADEITSIWQTAGIQAHAVTNTYIDFLFIFFYSLFLFIANWRLSSTRSSISKKATQLIAIGALVAGFLDVAENYFLLKMLQFQISDAEAQLTWWLALIKFSLVGLAFIWILILLIGSIFSRTKSK